MGALIVRKPIKNLYIRVDRNDGRIRVSAPLKMSDQTIATAILKHRPWIEGRQRRVRSQAPLRPVEISTGTRISIFGVPHQVEIVSGAAHQSVEVQSNETVVLNVRTAASPEQRAALLDRWSRSQLGARIRLLVESWGPVMEVDVAEWRIKRMRTRWGTCNIRARRIWLNSELASRPPECLEYVIVHEMAHLLERRHNRRFYQLLDRFLPDWRVARALLRNDPPA